MHHDSQRSSYRVGQDNITPFGLDIHNPVFLISGLTIVLFILYALMLQEQPRRSSAGCARPSPAPSTGSFC